MGRMRSVGACLAMALAVDVMGQAAALAQPYKLTDEARRALSLLERREYQRAMTAAEAAVAKNPRDPIALAARGHAYEEVGDYRRAIEDHDLVLQMAPHNPGALANACWVRAVANTELDLALSYCDRSISRRPDFAGYDTRGFLHLRRSEFALALADYEGALKLRKKLASSLYGRGLAKLRLGNEAEGRADIAAAVKRKPVIADDYARRGMTP